jgi:putative sugar O-methyltransferase
MIREALLQRIERGRRDVAYEIYLDVRDHVLDMIQTTEESTENPSEYWVEEVAGFEYLLDASPFVVQKLREHCHHITGIRSYEYRKHHTTQRAQFANKLAALRERDNSDLFVPESSQLGGFGHDVDGQLVNLDTLKFYEMLIGLDSAAFLTKFREEDATRHTVLEIGAGWGGFGYQFKTLFPNVTYVIIDLPSTILFSAVYLRTVCPDATAFIYGDGPVSSAFDGTLSYDFVFLPHHALNEVDFQSLDLTINSVSFQEMTSDQIESYAKMVSDAGCPLIYSLNRDRSRYNTELTTVSEILERYYDLEEINVLPVSYTSMELPEPLSFAKKILRPEELIVKAKRTITRFTKGPSSDGSLYRYRHLAGRLKTQRETPTA